MRAVIEGWLPVLAFLTAIFSGILALSEYRGWPAVLFVSGALLCLMFHLKRPRRPVVKVIAALVGTTTLVLGGLSASYAVLGLPLNAEDLERTCTGRTPHPRSAPLGGDRVTRVFLDAGTGLSHLGDYDVRPVETGLAAVQQVACMRRIGSRDKLNSCSYGLLDQVYYTVNLYQGIWEMDVREARTGRTLAVVHVDGDTGTTCPSISDAKSQSDKFTTPSAAAVRAALS